MGDPSAIKGKNLILKENETKNISFLVSQIQDFMFWSKEERRIEEEEGEEKKVWN